jgi:CheY-like chemotaxis protein
MSGYQLAQALRAGTPPFQGGLIAVTGYGQHNDVRQALEAGFDSHLTKPVAPQELLQVIAQLLARERQH